ncbi:MAG: ABC transporter ATP-binding protein [Rhizobiaceae bacterium]|nr:ABC transporter ATP-binding protein [Rhizobiaceae bacterium]
MAKLSISNIEKSYGNSSILKGIDLDIEDGEFIALVGPSGCGKSTLLRIIAGLETHDGGSISINGELIDGLRASQRNLAMVFQSYALYPHLSVFENIAVPLQMRFLNGWQRLPFIGPFLPGARKNIDNIKEMVRSAAETLDLLHLLDRKPGQLSGGQRQRVAVGRALVREPQAFLLDEPLSNLDAKLRVHMRTEITELHRRLEATFVYVTHDQAEAMTMADRIAIMMDGELLQVAPPYEVYHNPTNIQVAEFIGSPKINILNVGQDNVGNLIIARQIVPFTYPHATISKMGVRPEAISIVSRPSHLHGKIAHWENFGAEAFFHIVLEGLKNRLIVRGAPTLIQTHKIGDEVNLELDLEQVMGFNADGARLNDRFIAKTRREVA